MRTSMTIVKLNSWQLGLFVISLFTRGIKLI